MNRFQIQMKQKMCKIADTETYHKNSLEEILIDSSDQSRIQIIPFIHYRRSIIDQKIPFTASHSKVESCHRYRSLERLFPTIQSTSCAEGSTLGYG